MVELVGALVPLVLRAVAPSCWNLQSWPLHLAAARSVMANLPVHDHGDADVLLAAMSYLALVWRGVHMPTAVQCGLLGSAAAWGFSGDFALTVYAAFCSPFGVTDAFTSAASSGSAAASPASSTVQDATRNLVKEVLDWQRATSVTHLPKYWSEDAIEKSLGNRFKKLLLQRHQSLGDRPGGKQLTPPEVVLVTAVPGVKGSGLHADTHAEQGQPAGPDQGAQPASATDLDEGAPVQKKVRRINPRKKAFTPLRKEMREVVQMKLRKETGAKATHADTEERLSQLWLCLDNREKEVYYERAGVSSAGLQKHSGKRPFDVAFATLAKNMGARQRRVATLKKAISQAGSGSEIQAIIAALTKDQQIELLDALQIKHPDRHEEAWKSLAR